jgi:hypothetical protein
MNWKMMKILLAFAPIVAVTLLLALCISNNGINERQVLAQQIDMTTNITNTSATGGNISNITTSTPGQSIFYRGIEASEEPIYLNFSHPGMKEQTINILPHRDDGASYKGVLTFTATEPVGVGIGHKLPVNKDILSQNQSEELRDLTTVTYNEKGGELGDLGLMSASSIINPDYGVSPPYFSASIPFAGSNLYLTTQQSEPFVAVYEVSADIVQPQNIVDLDGLNSGTNTTVNTLP